MRHVTLSLAAAWWLALLPHLGLHARGDSDGHVAVWFTAEWGLP